MNARNPWTRPSVIVAKEKHETLYYSAATEEEFLSSALAILKARHAQGYWYLPVENELDREPGVDLTEEGLKFLAADSESHKLYRSQVRERNRWREDRAEYQSWWDQKNQAIDTNDRLLAWRCLQERSGAEYEAVRLEPLL